MATEVESRKKVFQVNYATESRKKKVLKYAHTYSLNIFAYMYVYAHTYIYSGK